MNHRSRIVAASGLFFLSGFSGLVFETAWTRLFLDLFGHGIHTAAAVLAAFMGGLGLGAAIGGRIAEKLRRPLKWYGLLELGIGAWVAFSPFLVAGVDRAVTHVEAGLVGTGGAGVLSWIIAFVLLIVPTSFMGATLPMLCRALIEDEDGIGRVFGVVYGINTLGAVAGVVGTGFWFLKTLGVHGSLVLGCMVNLAAAVGAMMLDRRGGGVPERDGGDHGPGVGGGIPARWLFVVAVTGFCAMALEVVWIRAFVFVLGSSILSLSTVLGTLLASLACGAFLLPRLVRSREMQPFALGWTQAFLGVTAIGGLLVMARLDQMQVFLGSIAGATDPLGAGGGRFAVVAVIVFLPGLAMGATLPAATGAISGLRGVEGALGRLYAANTAGNVAGALAAGYLLIPLLGASRSIVALGVIELLVAAAVLAGIPQRRTARRWAGVVLVLSGAVLATTAGGGDRLETLFSARKAYGRLVDVSEGLRGTVTVLDVPPLPILAANADLQGLFSVGAGYRLLAVDGVDVAGSSPDLRTTQKMQAHVPLLLHGSPRRVLQIGHGSGATAQEVGLYRPELFDLVEINPQVIEEAHRWFPQWAGGVFNPIFADAKNYVRRTRKVYDVILNDSTYPGHTGSSQLYSADHFRACREHLAPGGIVSTWLPIDLPRETFATVLASFRSVFPECGYWLPLNCWNKHGVLVGSLEPFEGRVDRLRRGSLPSEVAESLAIIGLNDPEVFISTEVLDGAGIDHLAAGAPLNTDDRPILEYPARGWQVSGEVFWAETLEAIGNSRVHVRADRSKDRAIGQLIEGQLRLLANDPDGALEFYRRAGLSWPEHPGPHKLTEDIDLFRAQELLRTAAAEGSADDPEILEEAARLCPTSALIRYELGRALFERRRFSEAVPHLEAALERGRGFDRAWLFLGDIRAVEGRPGDAERYYRAYLEKNPPVLEILLALGDVIAEQGRLTEARGLFEKANALAPDAPLVAERLRRLSSVPVAPEP